MILQKAYGKSTITAGSALLMAFAMIVNQSLVARTFGSYTMQLFDVGDNSFWIPILGVLLLVATFLINIAGNKAIQRSALIMAVLKVGGIAIFSIGRLWAAGFSFEGVIPAEIPEEYSIESYLGALALAILATVSSVVANVFAVSRITAMLTKMKLIPHSHFGMPGRIQKHMLVYTVVIAIVLTIFLI